MTVLTLMRNGLKTDGFQLWLKFVALPTGQILMLTIEGELSQTEMIKFWNLPAFSRMTILTELFIELFTMNIIMASVTTGVSILILDDCCLTFVTGRAIQILMLPG